MTPQKAVISVNDRLRLQRVPGEGSTREICFPRNSATVVACSIIITMEEIEFPNCEDIYQSAYAHDDMIMMTSSPYDIDNELDSPMNHEIQVAFVERETSTLKDGYLWKEGSRVKSWKKRYFILQYYSGLECSILSYYTKETKKNNQKPLGIIDFYEVVDVKLNPECTKNTNGITLSIIDKELREFHIATETYRECEAWFEAFKLAKARTKRSAAEELTSFANLNNKIFDTVLGILGQKKIDSPIPEEVRQKVECLRRIKQFTCLDLEFEFNEASCLSFEDIPEEYHGNLELHIISNYLKCLSDRIVTYVSENSKHLEALSEVVYAKKIIFEFNSETVPFVQVLQREGLLVIQVAPKNFLLNVSDTGSELADLVAAHSVLLLPLNVRNGVLTLLEKKNEYLKQLNKIVGTMSFTCNCEALYNVQGIESSCRERIPAFIEEYLRVLIEKLELFLQDPLQREAFAELTTSKQIGFCWSENNISKSSYFTRIITGILYIQVHPAQFGIDVDKIGDDLMTTYANCPSYKLPLIVRIGIRDNQQNLKKYLKDIEDVTGIQYEFEVDYEAMYFDEEVPKSQLVNMPSTVINGYLSHFSQRMIDLCQDERMKKELISDTSQSQKIAISFGEIDRGYNQTFIYSDGTIAITLPASKFGSAVHETGQDLRYFYELEPHISSL